MRWRSSRCAHAKSAAHHVNTIALCEPVVELRTDFFWPFLAIPKNVGQSFRQSLDAFPSWVRMGPDSQQSQRHFVGPRKGVSWGRAPPVANPSLMSQSAKIEHRQNCSQLLGGGTDRLPATRFRGRERVGPRPTETTHGLANAKMAERSSRCRVSTMGAETHKDGVRAERHSFIH
jgi:hypothetical protein